MDLRSGTLREFNAATYQATVHLDGSRQTSCAVPVSRAIPQAELVAGRHVGILEFWEGDPTARVVAAVW
ncbi:MAG: hypothetical protein M1401_17415 [Chloroflexi bacterium]|nr:hypothetical protein [Chloroflexota bacterium]